MDNILSHVPDGTETRHHQRLMVLNGVFAVISPGTDKEWKVQTINISPGGMAFIYHGSKDDLEPSGVIEIIAGNAESEDVNFETVYDEPAPGSGDESLPSRRRGVKFKWLADGEKSDLRDFIYSINN